VNPTAAPAKDEADRTNRYWKAAISALSTPEKREIAEEFLRRKLESGAGADTLFALIVLLEANGAFLLKLPEKLNLEFTQPITEHLEGFENALIDHEERQKGALSSLDRVQRAISDTAALIQESRRELAIKIQTAAASLDASVIASSVSETLQKNIFYLLRLSLANLDNSTERAVRATQAAEQSVQTWRNVRIRSIAIGSTVIAVLMAGCVLCWGWWSMENHYRTRLATQVVRLAATDDAYRQLLWLGVSISVAPWEDESGKTVRNGYMITIDDAAAAAVKTTMHGNKAVVLLKAQPLVMRAESLRNEANKLRENPQSERQKWR
jgi:hypothetical protein